MYWLVSVPFTESYLKTFNELKDGLSKFCEVERFKIPILKPGTVNSLMTLCDEIVKHDRNLEAICSKAYKSLKGLDEVNKAPEIQIDDEKKVPLTKFLKNFEWNESQYMVNKDLPTLVTTIVKKAIKFEEELRVKFNEFQTLKSNITSLQRKKTGTLLVRALDGVIKKEHVVDTEYLKTIFVVVQKQRLEEWKKKYENLGGIEYIVPDSSTVVFADNDFSLVNVVVLKKYAQDFKTECIKEKFAVRDFEFDDKKFELSQQETKTLEEKRDTMKNEMLLWCRAGFSEVFSGWIHLKAIRMFCESILRYGLPPDFVTVILSLKNHQKRNVHKFFKTMFSDSVEEELFNDENTGNESSDFYSYVLVEVNPKVWK